MASQSTRLPSAISRLPHDILTEIFPHCLPRSPIDALQPNPRIAPMLLCHVCSSWRTTALATPSLWSCLYLRLPINWDKELRRGPSVWAVKTFRKKLQCLKWWKENQGAKAPFVRFEFDRPEDDYHPPMLPKDPRLTGNTLKFIVEYLASAQYLDVSLFLRYLFKQDDRYTRDRDNEFNLECPHLHTVVVKFPNYGDDDDDDQSYCSSHSNDNIYDDTLPPLVIDHIPPTLRRFSMPQSARLPSDYNHWSTLTHLSLKDLFIPSSRWFDLIHGVSRLQWGNFTIHLLGVSPFPPPHITLPFLLTLSMDVDNIDDGYVDYPLSILFQNLEFPTLKTLSLCSNSRDSWHSPYAIKEVNNVLRSAPAITKLALGPEFLSSAYTRASVFEKVFENESPLSVLAPRLNHLEVGFCCSDEDDDTKISQYFAYWETLFFSMNWLDLSSPTNTVQTMSIFIKAIGDPSRLAFPIRMGNKVIAAIQEYVEKTDDNDVEFRVFLGDNRETLQDGWQTWDLHFSE